MNDIKGKENIPNADVKEGKVYLFEDGEVYTARENKSVYSGNLYKYTETRIDPELAKLVYGKLYEVKFSERYNAMEFNNANHFNKLLQQEGYEKVKRLAIMLGLIEDNK